ncbi:MAG: sel1 repeat family protein [Thiocapsa sp.]|uniref:sel1 repeat family protein n=1 Tax=Thiocapsa sp. TaxID=2024551 RepID=UPI001BD024F3|nr:sel1 repeat family protein [Thiocapsa sp.]QVL49160.1 MAG: sel1 repeat family protein [Thiocapsa sp.]
MRRIRSLADVFSRVSAGTIAAGITLLLGGCATTGPGTDPSAMYGQVSGTTDAPGATGYVIARLEDLTVVDCLLPGRLRKMGTTITWVGRPRPVKKTISDCEILGGQYVLFDRADFDTALAVWKFAAEQGDPTAQTYVGEIFERGLGRAPDYATAAQWYRKAAVQGSPRAQLRLGALYEKGLGVQRDPVEALDWFRQAAGLQKDKIVYLSQAVAEAKRRSPGSAPRLAATPRTAPPRSAPHSPPPVAATQPPPTDLARQPRIEPVTPLLPDVVQPAREELKQITAVVQTRNRELIRAESARDRAKEDIVLRSQETRLMDQARPAIRADRRLIDQYVALTQEAETQRVAAEGLERVLEVAAPVLAQQ